MSIKIIGWGKWGNQACKAAEGLLPKDAWRLKTCDAADLGLPHLPDPVISDYVLSNSSREQISALIESDIDYHMHLVHAGDNFASGAICGLMRRVRNEGNQTHIGLIFLPPKGENSAGVGRLLANIAGLKKFFDICVILDSTAHPFAELDTETITKYAACICSLFSIFDKSACMLPLLEQMDARFLSFSAMPIHRILEECSLEELWHQMTLTMNHGHGYPKANCHLFFSVSSSIERELNKIIKRNIQADKGLYIPFLRLYDWKYAYNPYDVGNTTSTYNLKGLNYLFKNLLPNRRDKDFIGVFSSDIASKGMVEFIKSYHHKYWPEGHSIEKYENYELEVEDWFKSYGMLTRVSLQHKYIVKSAYNFMRELFQKQKGCI